MIIIRAPQGSDDWRRARAGVITGSMFAIARQRVNELTPQQKTYVAAIRAGSGKDEAKALAGYKSAPTSSGIEKALAGEKVGEPSGAAKDYAFRLAIERISGEPLDEGFETWAMRRGHELEPEARFAHESAAGVVVEPCGLILSDDGAFGISADGLIGDDEGSEYKCLVDPFRLRTVHIDHDISEFADQCQGGLWLSGRARWHFGLYCPALRAVGRELWWRIWQRDEAYIEALESDLVEFKALVDSYEIQLRNNPQQKAA